VGPSGPPGPIGPPGPAGPPGIASTNGQNVFTSGGTVAIGIDSTVSGYTVVPGLSQTVDVPANSILYVSTDGGIQSTNGVTIAVALFVNDVQLGPPRIIKLGAGGLTPWSLSRQVIAQGSTTIDVRARYFGGDHAFLSSPPNFGDQGILNIVVLRQ
jgi:hypothetical protein